MTIDLAFSRSIKGFMDDEEAIKLHEVASIASQRGPCLEIGSYCGKSTYFIGLACQEYDSVLYAVDHHQGSEEQQPGEAYFDPDLYDAKIDGIDTFPHFRRTLKRAGLVDNVIPVVTSSVTAGKMWATPLAMIFIDGGHSFEVAMADYETWTPHLISGGILVIHDIFFDPAKGGQAPRQVYETALDSGHYDLIGITGTLGVLKKRNSR